MLHGKHLGSLILAFAVLIGGGTALASEESPMNAKFVRGEGFTLESTDGNYKLNIGGVVQARYDYHWLRSYTGGGLSGAFRNSTFRVRAARLDFRGHIYRPAFQFRLELDASVTRALFRTMYVAYEPTSEFRVQLGRMKVPYNRQEMTSRSKQQFVDRSSITNSPKDLKPLIETERTFSLEYDLGASISGMVFDKKFEYYVGVFNGNDNGIDTENIAVTSEFNSINSGMLYSIRIVGSPLGYVAYDEVDLERSQSPRFAVGTAYYLDQEVRLTGNSGRVDISAFTADLAFRFIGISINAEYHLKTYIAVKEGATGTSIEGEPELDYDGYNVQFGYLLPIEGVDLEIAGRYAKLNANEGDEDFDFFVDQREADEEYGGAINWYIDGHNVKLSADYLVYQTTYKSASTPDRRRQLRFQFQIRL